MADMTDKPIREWSIDSHPDAKFVRFARERVPTYGPSRSVTDHVTADEHGVTSYTVESDGETVELNSGDTDIVLAAVFRQSGIVDDLDLVLDIAAFNGCKDAAARIRKALGEALS